MEDNNITRSSITEELKTIDSIVESIMFDMDYDENEYIKSNILFVKNHYCMKIGIPLITEDDIVYLSRNYVFSFEIQDNEVRLSGRMEFYSVKSTAFLYNEIIGKILIYLDTEDVDLGEMAQHIYYYMRKQIKKCRNSIGNKKNSEAYDIIFEKLSN